ncbi:MAG: hypothetical protein ACK5ZU_15030 [Acidobacteriota bacterium]|jgi:hypothetical protein
MAEQATNKSESALKAEEISLEMMKFIAVQTGYGKSSGSTAGFGAKGANTPEVHAEALLELFQRCLKVVKAD